MANHKSALKRIRQNAKNRVNNKYHAKTMRNALRSFLKNENKKEVEENLAKMTSMIDKLAKRNIIHKNKAANLKSEVSRHSLDLKK
ncbi:MAG TPA: 30S ribosomal protein S20 [Flavobacteriales bacterium]|nr:30S ribosomal protein S20 [Flavobacteriales bacterium]